MVATEQDHSVQEEEYSELTRKVHFEIDKQKMPRTRSKTVTSRSKMRDYVSVGHKMIARLAILILLLTAPQKLWAQQSPDWHFRYELFQRLLEEYGLNPVNSPSEVFNDPENSVIVYMGELTAFPPDTIQEFCRQGGSALIASDGTHNLYWLGRFNEGPVQATSSAYTYQNYTDCLEVPITQAHPLLDGVATVVVNRGGYLRKPRFDDPEWDYIGTYPQKVNPRTARGAPFLAENLQLNHPSGYLLMSADQSMLTNGMFWHGDNATLAINIAKQLSSPNRTKLLLVCDSTVLGSYRDSPFVPDDIPPAAAEMEPPDLEDLPFSKMLEVANEAISEVQQRDVGNRLLANQPRRINPVKFRRAAILVLVGIVVFLLLLRLLRGGRMFSKGMPSRKMKTAHEMASAGRAEASEFGLAASMLARELCRDITESDAPESWVRQLKSDMHGSSRVAKRYRMEVAELVDIAVSGQTIGITRQRFMAIGYMIQRLRQLHLQQQLVAAVA